MKLYKVWAEWCQPCYTLTRVMEGMEYESVDLETEEGMEFAHRYKIHSLPTLLITDGNGEKIAMRSGLIGRQDIERWIGENVEE